MRLEKDIKYITLAIFVFVIEETIGKYIEISGAVPMIALCFCIVSGLVESDMSYAVTAGVILGILEDIFGGHGFGTYTISFAFSSFVSFYFKDSIFSSKMLFLAITTFLLTVLIQLFYRFTHIYDMGTVHFWYNTASVVIPMAVYNTVISLLYYPIHKRLFKKGGKRIC